MNRLLACCLLGLAGLVLGCAGPRAPEPALPPAKQVWERFVHEARDSAVRSLQADLVLHYSDGSQHRRLTAEFWGNLDHPVRLDIAAGIGALISSWREDERAFVAYYPREGVAYVETGTAGSALGDELPLGLRDLALLLSGNLARLLPAQFVQAEPVDESSWRYRLPEGALAADLILDRDGRPLALTSHDGWRLGLESDEPPWRQEKLRLTGPANKRIIMTVKDLKTNPAPMAEDSLALELPEDTRLESLPDHPDKGAATGNLL